MTIFLTNKSEELSTHIFWSQLGSSLILTNQSRDKPPPGRRFLCAPLVNCVRVDEFSVQFPAPLVWSRWEIWWEMVELFPLGCATWRCFLSFELTLWNAQVIFWGGHFMSLIHQRWNPGLDSYRVKNQSRLSGISEERKAQRSFAETWGSHSETSWCSSVLWGVDVDFEVARMSWPWSQQPHHERCNLCQSSQFSYTSSRSPIPSLQGNSFWAIGDVCSLTVRRCS